jgi:hypothetical protein
MSVPNRSSSLASEANLHGPLATLIIGVTGNSDPQGYDAKVVNPLEQAPSIKKIYLRVWQLLDWVFGMETKSPLGFPSEELMKLGIDSRDADLCLTKSDLRTKNECEFVSGSLRDVVPFAGAW